MKDLLALRAAVEAVTAAPLEPLTLKARVPSGSEVPAWPPCVSTSADVLTLEALSATFPADGVESRTLELQAKLAPLGIQAVLTAKGGGKDFCFTHGVGLLEASEQFAEQALVAFFRYPNKTPLLFARGTNGANYEVDAQDIVDRLNAWSARCRFRLVGAGFDWVELAFQTLPADLGAFAEEVYAFCPDTLDQGIVKPPPEGFAPEDPEEVMAWMDEALEEQTPADLAEAIRRDRSLWLWWD